MARSKSITTTLKELSEAGEQADRGKAVETLRGVLSGSSSPVVAEAAELAGRLGLTQLGADLQAAFQRFLGDGMRADKSCRAKVAIVKALHQLKSERTEPFVVGMTCYWPSRPRRNSRDVATDLRIAAAYAYAELGAASEVEELAGLLADPVDDVRLAAVQSIAALNGAHFGPLLRLKTLLGDENPSVMEACFDALIDRDKVRYLPLIAEHLEADDPRVQMAAAVALGRSRHPSAFDLLAGKWRRTADTDVKAQLLITIALLRSDRGIEFLLSLIDNPHSAGDALAALKYCHTQHVREQVKVAVDRTGDSNIIMMYKKYVNLNEMS
ncbi:HEAT repeat domain-containing protein [bacterium]|nr:HEAT repeat domain-containing protein [bacterium]